MLYLLHGKNFKEARIKLKEIIFTQQKKTPDASYFKITSDNWTEFSLQELVSTSGLFQNKFIIVLDGLLEDKGSENFFINSVKELQNSENIFVIFEEKISKDNLKKISKFADKIQVFDIKSEMSKEQDSFNTFNLTDALGSRDKKRLWLLYQESLRHGVSAEEMHRLLFWQTKSILASILSKDSKQSGLNPFVYRKSLAFSKNFTKNEVAGLSAELIRIYHDARRGIVDIDVSLEKFVLSV